jgi:hypothetical protein
VLVAVAANEVSVAVAVVEAADRVAEEVSVLCLR